MEIIRAKEKLLFIAKSTLSFLALLIRHRTFAL